MRWGWGSSGVWILTVISVSAFGCGASGSMTHLIPDGYVGPVVIVFDDPKGKAPKRDEKGGVVYEIPPDGVLRLNTPAPEAGLYEINFLYVRPDGTTTELPERAEDGVLQIFAMVDGATAGEKEERPPDRWTWTAYVIGVPSERGDWVQARGKATSRAIGIPGLL